MLPNTQPSNEGSAVPLMINPGAALAVAFASFQQAAGALEKSYGLLRTEVAELRAQLKEKDLELEREREATRRVQSLAEISTLLAHEIRNPLASLELFAGLLAESREMHTEDHRWASQIQAGLRTLAATVNNVLHFHSLPLAELMPVHPGELVRTTMAFIRPLAEQTDVRCEFVDKLGDTRVAADPSRLQQVLLNLTLNAIRYMQSGGELTITGRLVAGRLGKAAELAVSDTGPGISIENHAKIFEAGFTTRPGSPGLGLAVCKKIMEQHGGRMWIDSGTGGTTFILQLKAL